MHLTPDHVLQVLCEGVPLPARRAPEAGQLSGAGGRGRGQNGRPAAGSAWRAGRACCILWRMGHARLCLHTACMQQIADPCQKVDAARPLLGLEAFRLLCHLIALAQVCCPGRRSMSDRLWTLLQVPSGGGSSLAMLQGPLGRPAPSLNSQAAGGFGTAPAPGRAAGNRIVLTKWMPSCYAEGKQNCCSSPFEMRVLSPAVLLATNT